MRGFTVGMWGATLSDCENSTEGDAVVAKSGFCRMIVGPVGVAMILASVTVDAAALAYGHEDDATTARIAPWIDLDSESPGLLLGGAF
jgi:hypothetical protein